MEQIRDRRSYFVSRLRRDCDPVITGAKELSWLGRKLSEIVPGLEGQELDIKVHLAKFRSNPMKQDVRLVGQKHEGEWYFYVTNLTEAKSTPEGIHQIYAVRWQIEFLFNDLKQVVNLNRIFSRSVEGIQAEIFSALVY